jgi:PAS domain S-box-containing protein
MKDGVEEALKQQNRNLEFLKQLAFRLAGLGPEVDLPAFLTTYLKKETGASVVTFSSYDPQIKALITVKIESNQTVLRNVIRIAGRKILTTISPVNDAMYKEMVQQVVAVHHSLTDLSFGAISESSDKALRAITGIDRFYAISLVVAGELFGAVMLGFSRQQVVPAIEVLESFASLAAVSLRRKKAEDASREREEKYRLLVESQGEGLCVVDPEETFIFVNPAAEEIFGVQPGNLLHRSLLEFVVPEHIQVVKRETGLRIQANRSSYEIDILTPAGEKRNLLVTATPQLDKQKKHIATFGIFRDITERKQAELALRISEKLYRNLVERMPDGVYKSSHDGKFVEVNDAMVRMLGYESREELMAIDIKTQLYLQPSDRESLVLQEQLEELGIYQLKKKDGSAIWVEDHGWYIQDDEGKTLFHEGILRDISERKRAEDALRESEERYRVFINSTKDMAFLKDDKFNYQFVNKSLAGFFGKEEREIIGRQDAVLMPEEAAARCHATDVKSLTSPEVVVSEELIGDRIYETHKFRVPLGGSRIGIGGYIRDVTERRSSELQLQRQAEELKALNASRDKFFSIIAHDLRSPFNSILGFSDLLLENYRGLDTDAVEKSLHAISGAAKSAYVLLENLLIWSSVQTGRITLTPTVIDLKSKVEHNIELLKFQAARKNIRFFADIPEHLFITADVNMLGTILRNLMTNSVKFTRHDGSILVTARREGHFVEISIKDNGVGIDPQKLKMIFMIDSKTSTPGTEREKGTGLGLILCREFVEKHGGRIWAESEVGKGSTFYFTMSAGMNS